jgi:hypothetical protein
MARCEQCGNDYWQSEYLLDPAAHAVHGMTELGDHLDVSAPWNPAPKIELLKPNNCGPGLLQRYLR